MNQDQYDAHVDRMSQMVGTNCSRHGYRPASPCDICAAHEAKLVADARAQGRREGLEENRGALLHLEAGLEHIIDDDECEQCKDNFGQARFLADYIRKLLEAK